MKGPLPGLGVLRRCSVLLTAVMLALVLASLIRPVQFARGEQGIFLLEGSLGIVIADTGVALNLRRGNMPVVQLGRGAAVGLRGPRHWIWSKESASITVGMPGAVVTNSVSLYWLPLWMPLLISAAFPAISWWRSRRAPGPGHCSGCGYNIAGLGDRCPECGREVAGPAAAHPQLS